MVRFLFLSAGCAIALAAPGMANDTCPLDSSNLDDLQAAITAAPSCSEAYRLLTACSLGATGDVALAEPAIKACENDFLAKLPTGAKRAYAAKRKVCRNRYARKEGSMYVSFAVMCEAQVAADYSRQAKKSTAAKNAR
jgi:hypothetical protein